MLEDDDICQSCPTGEYSLNANWKPCTKCPRNAECSSESLKIEENYWGFEKDGMLVLTKCPARYCCQSSDKCTFLNFKTMEKGGILSNICPNGFLRFLKKVKFAKETKK